jgi:ferredoxin
MDAALTALRQGAKHVDMVFRKKRRQLSTNRQEIEKAVAEGVHLHPGWFPLAVSADGEVTFQRFDSGADDVPAGKAKPEAAARMVLEADHVILATGQGADVAGFEASGLEVARGFIATNGRTLMTNLPGVFAGGDVAHGPRTVVEAIRSGRIAAHSIDAWLRGAPLAEDIGKPVPRAEVAPIAVSSSERSHKHRAEMRERTVQERSGTYVKIEEGLTDAMAHDEAARCLRCDMCIGCGLCQLACSEMGVEALRMAETLNGRLAYLDYSRPAARCIGCGACAQVCPTGAIRVEDAEGLRRTIITGTVVHEEPVLKCARCGSPTQTRAHLDFMRRQLPSIMTSHLDRHLCPACARQAHLDAKLSVVQQ